MTGGRQIAEVLRGLPGSLRFAGANRKYAFVCDGEKA
jgi:hypothetical protein